MFLILWISIILLSRSSPEINSIISTADAKALIQNNASLILFYGASWCPYTLLALRDWNEAIKTVKNTKIEIHRVECGDGQCTCFGIAGVPEIIFYENGKKEIYDGDRSEEDFIEFFKEDDDIK